MIAQSPYSMTFLPSSIFRKGIHTLLKVNNRIPLPLKKPFILPLLQQLFNAAIDDGDMDFLSGRIIKIYIIDSDSSIYLGYQNKRLQLHKPATADVCISGAAEAFIHLAARLEDPDTLFFQRRLMIEGDTDLGLEFKNILDAIDYDTVPGIVQHGLEFLAHRLADQPAG